MWSKSLFIAVALSAGTVAAQEEPMDDTMPAEDEVACPAPECPEENVEVEAEAEAAEAAPMGNGEDVNVDVDVETAAPAPIEEPTTITQPENLDVPGLPLTDESLQNIGAELKVGAGGGDYTQEGVRDLTSAGPVWDVRAVFGGNFPVGIEGAYTGSSRNVSNSFANGTGDTQLVSNGLEGDLRLAVPISTGGVVDIRPFAFGGLGWQYMTMRGDGAVDGDNDDGDHIMTIPAGVGLDMGIGALNLDLRGIYRHAVGSELFGESGSGFDDTNALHSYAFTGSIGVEY